MTTAATTTVMQLRSGRRIHVDTTVDTASGAVAYQVSGRSMHGTFVLVPASYRSENTPAFQPHVYYGALSHPNPAGCTDRPFVGRHILTGETTIELHAMRTGGPWFSPNLPEPASDADAERAEVTRALLGDVLRVLLRAWQARTDLPELATTWSQTHPENGHDEPQARPVAPGTAAPTPVEQPPAVIAAALPAAPGDGPVELPTAAGDTVTARITVAPLDYGVIYRVSGPRITGAVTLFPRAPISDRANFDRVRLLYGIGRDDYGYDTRAEPLTVNGVRLGGSADIDPDHIDPRSPYNWLHVGRHEGGSAPAATRERVAGLIAALVEHYLTAIDPRIRQAAIGVAATAAIQSLEIEIEHTRQRIRDQVRTLRDHTNELAALAALAAPAAITTPPAEPDNDGSWEGTAAR